MRVLKFENAEHAEHYKILYEGLALTQKQFSGKEQRRLDKVFATLESVGQPVPERNNYNFQELKSFPCEVEMEDADYEILKSAVEPPNVSWNGFGARKAGKMLNWLDSAPEKDVKPKLVE